MGRRQNARAGMDTNNASRAEPPHSVTQYVVATVWQLHASREQHTQESARKRNSWKLGGSTVSVQAEDGVTIARGRCAQSQHDDTEPHTEVRVRCWHARLRRLRAFSWHLPFP